MSFGYNAVGTKDEVVTQLERVGENTHGSGQLGPESARLLIKHIQQDQAAEFARPDHEYRYVITANGHSGGGSPTSLTLNVQAHYLHKPADEAGDGKSKGQRAYEAYHDHCGGTSVRGEALPGWDDQADEIRHHWEAAAAAV